MQQDMQQRVSDSHCKSGVKHTNNKESLAVPVKLALNMQKDMQQGVNDSHCKYGVKHTNNKESVAVPVKLALNR